MTTVRVLGRLARAVATVASTLAVVSCSDEPTALNDSVAGQIAIAPTSASASSLGQEIQFTVRVFDRHGAQIFDVRLAWSSSDTTVLVSEGNGLFRTRANGTATATVALAAGDPFLRQDVEVVVQQQPAQIQFSADTLSLYALGQTAVVQARVVDALGSEVVGAASLVWQSANPAVATVDSSGKVTALADGALLISVQAGEITKFFLTRVSSTVRIAGCLSSPDVAGQTCSDVRLSVHFLP